MTADPAADYRHGRPSDCTAPSFSSHHEVAWRQPRREARAPWGVSSRTAKAGSQEVIRPRLDTGRDREAAIVVTAIEAAVSPLQTSRNESAKVGSVRHYDYEDRHGRE